MFSIVVVSWNSARELPALLAGIAANHGDAAELVVVDNGSSDGSAELVRASAPGARVLELATNRGFGGANNLGVREASGEVVVLLNPDTVLVDASLADLAEAARKEPALFGARLLNEDGTPQISAFPPVAGWSDALLAILPGTLIPRRLRMRCEPWRFESRLPAGWVSAACFAARRDLLISLGPFDERLHLYGEDTELGLRAARLGIPSYFAPDLARVVHLIGRSGEQRFADAGMRRKIEARRWIVRHHLGRLRAALDFGLQFLRHADRWLLKTILGRDASWDAAFIRALISGSAGGDEPRKGRAPLAPDDPDSVEQPEEAGALEVDETVDHEH